MSLYFKLETGEYKGEECKIGDIMMQFNKALHDLTGLDLCLCNAPIDEALKQEVMNKVVSIQHILISLLQNISICKV